MIILGNIDTYGWEIAVRGMRNPMNSWDKSDSDCHRCKCEECVHDYEDCTDHILDGNKCFYLGDADLNLMKRLVAAGTDHSKFMRFITVTLDITAPLYWWKEFDTYKVGTVANSCSTMHKIHEKKFSMDDFSGEHLIFKSTRPLKIGNCEYEAIDGLIFTIDLLNHYRELYFETKDKKYWWQLIQLLPSSYNQKRTVQLNYQVLRNIYHARKNHKLDEWKEFCAMIEKLPYACLITGDRDNEG